MDTNNIPPYNSKHNKLHLYEKQDGYCVGCLHHFPLRNLTVDHVVPRSRGGTHHISNLQLLCGACNSTKSSGSQEELLTRLREQGAINKEYLSEVASNQEKRKEYESLCSNISLHIGKYINFEGEIVKIIKKEQYPSYVLGINYQEHYGWFDFVHVSTDYDSSIHVPLSQGNVIKFCGKPIGLQCCEVEQEDIREVPHVLMVNFHKLVK